ncbi:hypothetical protein [Streptomyces cyaneofuscatus]|uniref:hypothetical protein n=1 Tax=Streptomyces cyaneofuscatus TaxID=66883 RepID=UPI0036DC1703
MLSGGRAAGVEVLSARAEVSREQVRRARIIAGALRASGGEPPARSYVDAMA